ncbi:MULTISPECIES: flap endonuclease Xni [unclassified Agarivorans]|uniref:flap endonuclease Xni n=1 Tax=unclassified Agarivorans TaxID=2636026 RepID=UPI0026E15CCC|nr:MULTISPECIES: flap endonuclease Xni [unclassified Agarivorans]MDO6687352.1 flap endonuclease Xni [Agarivorans sp. 3_MG-2023]MDO6717010.1 flap endonuclease Xni [Agarivorans sp. 2_MG-2023]
MAKQLVIIDALNLIRRIYAVQQQRTPDASLAKATEQALTSACKRIITTLKPSHIIAVFDGDRCAWREDLYPAYKQNRSPMPIALAEQLETLKDHLLDIGIDSISAPNEEADDICATLASKAAKANYPVTIISTDRGYYSLLTQGISLYDYFRRDYVSIEEVETKFGIKINQLGDYWSLVGINSVNVSGVPGVGNKSAQTLLERYTNTADILAEAQPDKLVAKVQANSSALLLAKQLLRLKTDLKLGFSLKQLRYQASIP